ncbi:ABC transporter ATP-binding protein [Nostoc sp. FACHB-888]|uniref:ABC transporter ATP-binding protein n=1 Tax=Nostoc sp. FACHB-888 TaxID=2692842 RepID=UPI001683C8B0|nr:ABC transporter ATP-binding protein [Nostoc sp. FACHB-888]MBD2246551.1 ABC transporter ATP-binding protein [Nostoc sp. FACHB-888]
MPLSSLTDIFKLAGMQKIRLIASGILAAIATVLGLVPFILIYWIIIELFNPPADQIYVWKLTFISFITIVARWATLGIASSFAHIAAYNILYDIRIGLSQKFGTLPLGYFNNKQTGAIKKVMNEDVESLELFIAHGFPKLVGILATFPIVVGYLFIVDWRMTLAAIAGVPLAIGSQKLAFRGSEKLVEGYYDAMEKMNNSIIEYIQGMSAIKAFSQTTESFSKYKESVREYHDYEEVWAKKSLLPWTLFTVSVTANIIFIIPVGIYLLSIDSISIPKFILFLLLGVGICAPLYKFVESSHVSIQLEESARRISAIMNESSLVESKSLNMPKDLTIEFRDVYFAYENNEVLHNISFVVPPKSITALVGPSGSGKTTITRLIARFWDVSKGAISIGGINIKDIQTEYLMSKIAFVFQGISLFNDTIYNNIYMGNLQANFEEVIAASKAAQCHDFIQALPNGYETVIGERGSLLSGGQQQRIAIARAIIKNAPIVILDEATAFIDPETEVQIQSAISNLVQDKTLLIIAHRLSTISDADQIIVVNKGQIVGKGRHIDLLKSNNLYSQMWDAHITAQSWGF